MVRAEDEDVEHKKLISFIYFRFYSRNRPLVEVSRVDVLIYLIM
jgi:hypothetical protein